MALTPPAIIDWITDSGTSNHTTLDASNLTSVHPPTSTDPSSIIVGNGSALPVTSEGDSTLPAPFYLNNVLVTPDVIQNLLSVGRFTSDNWCSMKFDLFGLSVKDLSTRNVITRCNSSGPLMLHEVCEALAQKEKMKQMVRSKESTSNGKVLVVRGREEQRNPKSGNRGKRQGERGRSKSRNKNKFCKYCKKNNHMTEDCWKLKNKEKRTNKSQEDGKAAIASGDSSDSGDVLIAFASCVSMNSGWILDSSCSYPLCINKYWFSTYEPVQNNGLVRMGDNTPCEVIGIGSVKIRTHDGMTCTLTNVRHVPTMFRNLISLSTIDNMGYKYFTLGGVLKVSKGSFVVMKGVMISANLYVLSGDTIIGNAIVSSAAVVTSDNCNDSKLWHMRLGYMSQLGLAELSKRGLLKGDNSNEMEFCEHCIFGKHKRVKFNTSGHTTKGILDYVHADLWEHSQKHSLGGCRYMLTIIDDYSRRVFPYSSPPNTRNASLVLLEYFRMCFTIVQ
jgi:hypothetical protein